MTRLGYKIPNFTYPGVGPDRLFDVVAAQAKEAEASGFDAMLVMDHFYQLPGMGTPDRSMVESYTLLAALARETSKVRLGTVVTCNTYRNPAVLAKVVTALDVVSGGRAQLGIGAGWYEMEHDAFGIEFGTFTDRFEKLDEALQIIIPMLRGERPTFEGKHYRVKAVMNEPPPISRIPVMIGGSGEKKTLRMVAQYADESNLNCSADELPRKLEALAGHCDRLGRDRSEINVTWQLNACIAPTMEEAEAELGAYLAGRGIDLASLDAEERARVFPRSHVGDPDTVGEAFARDLERGVDGFTVNMLANGHVPGRVTLLGETLAPLFA